MVVRLLERTGKLVTEDHSKKVVLLTGAAGSIGTAFCRRYGGKYQIVAVRHQKPLTVESQLQSYFDPFDGPPEPDESNGAVFEIRADLLQKGDLDRVVEVALARFGRIDIVLNAVGRRDQAKGILGAALRRAPDLFQLQAMVPMSVAAAVTQQFWRLHDRENAARGRAVVNLSAAASVDPTDSSYGPAASASKAALNVFSFHLAEELRPYNVRVTSVAPAAVPEVVSMTRVLEALEQIIEGKDTGQMLLMWGDGDEWV